MSFLPGLRVFPSKFIAQLYHPNLGHCTREDPTTTGNGPNRVERSIEAHFLGREKAESMIGVGVTRVEFGGADMACI